MNITILAGGLSPERDVSLTSASMVANALEKMGHNVCLADVYEGVIGHNVTCLAELCKTPEQAMTLFRSDITYSYNVPKIPPSLDEIKARNGGRLTPIVPGIIELCLLSVFFVNGNRISHHMPHNMRKNMFGFSTCHKAFY